MQGEQQFLFKPITRKQNPSAQGKRIKIYLGLQKLSAKLNQLYMKRIFLHFRRNPTCRSKFKTHNYFKSVQLNKSDILSQESSKHMRTVSNYDARRNYFFGKPIERSSDRCASEYVTATTPTKDQQIYSAESSDRTRRHCCNSEYTEYMSDQNETIKNVSLSDAKNVLRTTLIILQIRKQKEKMLKDIFNHIKNFATMRKMRLKHLEQLNVFLFNYLQLKQRQVLKSGFIAVKNTHPIKSEKTVVPKLNLSVLDRPRSFGSIEIIQDEYLKGFLNMIGDKARNKIHQESVNKLINVMVRRIEEYYTQLKMGSICKQVSGSHIVVNPPDCQLNLVPEMISINEGFITQDNMKKQNELSVSQTFSDQTLKPIIQSASPNLQQKGRNNSPNVLQVPLQVTFASQISSHQFKPEPKKVMSQSQFVGDVSQLPLHKRILRGIIKHGRSQTQPKEIKQYNTAHFSRSLSPSAKTPRISNGEEVVIERNIQFNYKTHNLQRKKKPKNDEKAMKYRKFSALAETNEDDSRARSRTEGKKLTNTDRENRNQETLKNSVRLMFQPKKSNYKFQTAIIEMKERNARMIKEIASQSVAEEPLNQEQSPKALVAKQVVMRRVDSLPQEPPPVRQMSQQQPSVSQSQIFDSWRKQFYVVMISLAIIVSLRVITFIFY